MSGTRNIRYAHPSHREHNERLERARQAKPRDVTGPWLASTAQALPQLRRAFDRNRDPLIRRELLDQQKTETERREESARRGHFIARNKQDKPEPALKPPRHLRGDADREGWLLAQRDAAMARAATKETKPEPDREQGRTPTEISPEPSR